MFKKKYNKKSQYQPWPYVKFQYCQYMYSLYKAGLCVKLGIVLSYQLYGLDPISGSQEKKEKLYFLVWNPLALI